MNNRVFVQAAVQTKFGELWDQDWTDLAQTVTQQALQQTTISLSQIDAIFVGSMTHAWVLGQHNLTGVVSQMLGVHIPIIPIEVACASGGVAFYQAVQAIQSGQYQRVLVLGVEKMADVESSVIAEALMGAAAFEEREAGLTFPGLYALIARAYMHQYGLSREDLAQVPVASHKWAKLNPLAQFPFEITPEQVINSSCVASPLGLLDCSGVSDGAAVVILSNKPAAVSVLSSQMATDSIGLMSRHSMTDLKAVQIAAKQAYQQAKLKPTDIDLAEVHDCFSIAQVVAMEDLGLAAKGKGIEAALGQKLPINTSGGLKACGHPVGATGVKQVVEIVTQLQGQAGARQISHPKIGLTHNVAGSGSAAVVSILRKEPG